MLKINKKAKPGPMGAAGKTRLEGVAGGPGPGGTAGKRAPGRAAFLAVALCLGLLLAGTLAAAAAGGGVTRIAGRDRYETSAQVARQKFDQAGTVILARGDAAGNYADGLAASLLAGVLEAPVLLTSPTSLPPSVAQEIDRLGAGRAIVLGGEAAVSPAVVTALRGQGLTVERLAGATRFETAVKIAERARQEGASFDRAFIVNGHAPADSLVAGAAAFRDRVPILQVTRDSIPAVTSQAMAGLGIQEVYLVGGTGVISPTVAQGFKVKDRLSGADRYATSVEMAKKFFPGSGDLSLVRGADANLADAIGASVLGQPVLYLQQTFLPPEVDRYLDQVLAPASRVSMIGGTAVLSQSVADMVLSKITGTPPPAVSVSRVTLGRDTLGLKAGEKATLTATVTVTPDEGVYKNVDWSSSDSRVATVENGTVTALAPGTATITAASRVDPTRKATCRVTVTAATGDDQVAQKFLQDIQAAYEDMVDFQENLFILAIMAAGGGKDMSSALGEIQGHLPAAREKIDRVSALQAPDDTLQSFKNSAVQEGNSIYSQVSSLVGQRNSLSDDDIILQAILIMAAMDNATSRFNRDLAGLRSQYGM